MESHPKSSLNVTGDHTTQMKLGKDLRSGLSERLVQQSCYTHQALSSGNQQHQGAFWSKIICTGVLMSLGHNNIISGLLG